MTAPGRNCSCPAAPKGNPREIPAIAHKLKTGAVTCLAKSALTTGYLFSLRIIIHQSNRSPFKCHVDRSTTQKSVTIVARCCLARFSFPESAEQKTRMPFSLGCCGISQAAYFHQYRTLVTVDTDRQFRCSAAPRSGDRATTASVSC